MLPQLATGVTFKTGKKAINRKAPAAFSVVLFRFIWLRAADKSELTDVFKFLDPSRMSTYPVKSSLVVTNLFRCCKVCWTGRALSLLKWREGSSWYSCFSLFSPETAALVAETGALVASYEYDAPQWVCSSTKGWPILLGVGGEFFSEYKLLLWNLIVIIFLILTSLPVKYLF